jgi:ribonuclease HI
MARGCHGRFKKKMKIKNWKETAKNRKTWRDLAEKAKTHKGL